MKSSPIVYKDPQAEWLTESETETQRYLDPPWQRHRKNGRKEAQREMHNEERQEDKDSEERRDPGSDRDRETEAKRDVETEKEMLRECRETAKNSRRAENIRNQKGNCVGAATLSHSGR